MKEKRMNVFMKVNASANKAALALVLIMGLIFLPACQSKQFPYLDLSNQEELEVVDKSSAQLEFVVATGFSPEINLVLFQEFIAYLEEELGLQVKLIQKQNYAATIKSLESGTGHFALINIPTYLIGKNRTELVPIALPEYDSTKLAAYVVTGKESNIEELIELKGKKFVLVEPWSLGGSICLQDYLRRINSTPEKFFANYYYSYNPENSIKAVLTGQVDGALVSGYHLALLSRLSPQYTSSLKIIHEFKLPHLNLLVGTGKSDEKLKQKLVEVLMNMGNNDRGQKVLQTIGINRFEFDDFDFSETEKVLERVLYHD
jgi:phosphonate transport system substrate-binding protein